MTISVNEAFAPVGAIKKLRTLPSTEENCGVFFNFTMIPPGVSTQVVHYCWVSKCYLINSVYSGHLNSLLLIIDQFPHDIMFC